MDDKLRERLNALKSSYEPREDAGISAATRRAVGLPDQSGFVSDVLLRTGLGQGLLMGGGDEIEAFFRSKFGDETYDQALEDVRKKLTVARNERPVQTATAEIGGSLLPVVGSVLMTPATGGAAAPAAAATTARTAGLVSQMLSSGGKAAAIGAGMGATEGFLKGEGGFVNRADRAIEEGITGGAVGGVIGAAAPVAKRAYSYVTASPTERAQSRVLDMISEQGDTPADVARRYAERQAGGAKPEILADLYPGSGIVAESRRVLTAPGANRNELTDQLVQRMYGQGGRVSEAFEKAVGTNKKYFDMRDELEVMRRTNAAPLYAAVYDRPIRNSVLDDLIERAPPRAFDEAKEAAIYEKLIFPNIIAVNKDGTRKIVGDYTVKDVDMIKRGLDAIIDAETNDFGKLSTKGQKAYTLKSAIVNETDKLVPEYAAARSAWAGPSAVMDAMKKGNRIFNERAEVTARDISKMGASEKEGFLVGVLDAVNDRLGRKVSGEDTTRAFRSGNAKAQVEAALTATGRDPQEARKMTDALFSDIEREASMARTNAALRSQSVTAPSLAQEQSFRENMRVVPNVLNDMRQGGLGGGLAGLIQRGADRVSTGMTQRGMEGTNAEIARLLFQNNPAGVASAMDELQRRAMAIQRAGQIGPVPGLLANPLADFGNR